MAKRSPLAWAYWVTAAVLFGLTGAAHADPNWRENGTSQAAVEGGQCVRPTPWMRRNHMALIKHDRNVTVHQGVRTVDGSLAECIECHANRDQSGTFVPVDAEGEFCASCHTYTATTLDCFSCHATVPVK